MAIPLYLSMTAAEFWGCRNLPTHTAWMACHFSPYGTGLTNLPTHLPKEALLILNDRTPVHGHDPKQIRQILADAVAALGCRAVLLDLQRAGSWETAAIVKEALSLPCPVCVSDIYARELDCPVFLPPVPLTCYPEEYLSPWQGREIWLEAATQSAAYTVTKTGCADSPCPAAGDFPFRDERLQCHYRTELKEDSVRFSIQRTKNDLTALLEQCAAFGVTTGVGLWQELR